MENEDYQGAYANMAVALKCLSDDMATKVGNVRETNGLVPFDFFESSFLTLQNRINDCLSQVTDYRIMIIITDGQTVKKTTITDEPE